MIIKTIADPIAITMIAQTGKLLELFVCDGWEVDSKFI